MAKVTTCKELFSNKECLSRLFEIEVGRKPTMEEIDDIIKENREWMKSISLTDTTIKACRPTYPKYERIRK